MNTFQHILVPTDFSEPSERALELAMNLAQQFGSSLTLAHFWELPMYPYMSGASAEFFVIMREAAEQQMATCFASVREKMPDAGSLCRMGVPWQEIVKAVEDVHADLVVMGTHGRRGIDRVLIGSVAEKVIRLSPVSVLTVPVPHHAIRT